ncbi:family 20 glycosylhydrolase [Actinomadura gamaensis]|uniref:beta-N-acetylhexosaminidase n=1 Tax=Actinomadura gamaensis TaxID=1763541 RepID=A0ABV9TUC3_9ACTN
MVVAVVPLPESVRPGSGEALRVTGALRVAGGPAETVAALVGRLHAPGAVAVDRGAHLALELGDPEVEPTPVEGIDPLGRSEGGLEAYRLVVRDGRATVTARSEEGLFRGATTFAQLIDADGVVAPVEVTDSPGFAWRGLSMDVARRFFTVDELERLIDLLALYKFNVLHLHLSDSQAWRLPITGWPGLTAEEFYSHEDFEHLVAYAAARFVTVVPELDMPGHVLAAVRAYPELQGADAPAHRWLAYLDPRAAEARRFTADVLAELARLSPGPFLHLGGDEAFGMPGELYARFVDEALRVLRATGKRAVAWQEVTRSGAVEPDDVVQAWTGIGDEFDLEKARKDTPEEHHPLLETVAAAFAEAGGDAARAVRAGAAVLVSPSSVLYLDRPYAEESLRAEQSARRGEVGFASYSARTCREQFDWTPHSLPEIPRDARLAGIEAAIWCETVSGFEDLAFLLLPRLPGVAEKAWTRQATGWEDHRGRLASHAVWWERLGWGGYYRSAEVFG